MTENRVIALRQKDAIVDPLTEILRSGARRLIAQAVEAEFETFLASHADLVLPDGRQRVVRHEHDPVRAIQTLTSHYGKMTSSVVSNDGERSRATKLSTSSRRRENSGAGATARIASMLSNQAMATPS